MPTAMQSLTPVLIVEAIEPVLPFWRDRLGFTVTAEVPHGSTLGFVMLAKDGAMVMYQTRASVTTDIGPLADMRPGQTLLFIEVADVDAVEVALRGIAPVIPRRRTFYGMDEVIVREPGGSIVIFAQPVAGG